MPVPVTVPHTLNHGGDAGMKKRKPLHGNVIETMKFGNVTVRVCDDFIAKTPEQIEKVLDDYHAAGWRIVEALVEQGKPV